MRGVPLMINISLPTDTLKNLSLDNSDGTDKYMVESKIMALDFDLIKRKYANTFNCSEEYAKSVDSILENDNCKLFIEFKNGIIDAKQKKAINLKAKDSLLIYGDIKGETLEYFRNNFTFILVYNGNKNKAHYNKIQNNIAKNAKLSLVRFGLETLKGVFFKEVFTYDQNEFEKFLETL